MRWPMRQNVALVWQGLSHKYRIGQRMRKHERRINLRMMNECHFLAPQRVEPLIRAKQRQKLPAATFTFWVIFRKKCNSIELGFVASIPFEDVAIIIIITSLDAHEVCSEIIGRYVRTRFFWYTRYVIPVFTNVCNGPYVIILFDNVFNCTMPCCKLFNYV